MRTTEDQKQQLQQVLEKIKNIKVAMLTTTYHSSKAPHSRPMAVLHHAPAEEALWFFTYANSEKAEEVKHQDQVNLNFVNEDNNVFVSITGTAEIVQDREMMEKLWNNSLKTWFPQGLQNPQMALLKVNVNEAEYWDTQANMMVKLFRKAKSIFTGHPDGKPEHKKVDLKKI